MKNILMFFYFPLLSILLLTNCRAPDQISPNRAPTADAGPDIVVSVSELVQLNASGSSDAENDLLSFQWEILARPRGSYVRLVSSDSIKSSFVPDAEGTYQIKLSVFDQIAIGYDTVSITATTGNTNQSSKWTVTTFSPLDHGVRLAVSSTGNIYVSDFVHHVIKKIAPEGAISLYAGTGQAGYADGIALRSQFNNPMGIAVDVMENVYVADNLNHCIRKIAPTGEVTTVAGFPQAGYQDGIVSRAQFDSPSGVAVDGAGNIYVADLKNHRIRKITINEVSTVAGNGNAGFLDGNGESAQFNFPMDLVVDYAGTIYVADRANHQIRKISQTGLVSSLAGSSNAGLIDGTGTDAQFNNPYGIACDSIGNVYVADFTNHAIRKVTPLGEVTTIAGSGTPGSTNGEGINASFNFPTGIAVRPNNKVYVAEFGNKLIRLVTFE